ncbi:transcriptional regulator SplA domain-containing protein [Bacillus sp. SJS]|uniref:transcriptional regulator SplA domain-containing protein n=1 Tax=Bacillus sp. SJS TaxID=1423321 RepID=UPI0012E82E09|nr:transcriptional regulator SplA domain-containing protein [Bacillus sp. SJS]
MDHKEDEKQYLNIDHAQFVQHPKNKDGVALFLKESYHLLSSEDLEQVSNEEE